MTRRPGALRRALRYLERGPRLADGWSEENPRDRFAEDEYRGRWSHDKVVRSTHGVNCTGSCSWQVHVKDGLVVFETQATDYPSLGPDTPEYEPRGCARGASFSWYLYSPLRVRHPYVRAPLLEAFRRLRAQTGDPVAAFARLAEGEGRAAYVGARGRGGFVRASWEEATELVAAALVHTVRTYGPDRVAGFSPIPAMSMVSYAAGSRFLALLGGTILSFYDWYADLPIASPQVFGEQTDVPESADWWNATYLLVWGSNVPMTRTPDAHFLAEVRYRGAKVVTVSADYAEATKFADLWLAPRPGTDGALALGMLHTVLAEHYVRQPKPFFLDYARRYTDFPFLVVLRPEGDAFAPGPLLRASDLGRDTELAAWKPLVLDEARDVPAVPVGTVGHRWEGLGRWNLRPEDEDGHPLTPRLSLLGGEDDVVPVGFPDADGGAFRRPVPVRRIGTPTGEVTVATVLDLLLAYCGVPRGLPGEDVEPEEPIPTTPAWQERLTGVPAELCRRVASELAESALRSRGRVMVIMGAGINHWYHSDLIYRAILTLLLAVGAEGRNGGGWAHYVGQEKVRPLEGFSAVAFAQDWLPAARLQNATSYWYFHSEQFRYDEGGREGRPGSLLARHPADLNALAVRLGWLPFYPQWRENPLATAREEEATIARRIVAGELPLAVEEPERPENFPRVLLVWRANLLGASAKGHEYFLTHLLGAKGHVLGPPLVAPGDLADVSVAEEVPSGKLDLVVALDFRMSGTALYADVVLPAATWYEKADLSSTDMHPFVHPFQPAVDPPFEAKSDWEAFVTLARAFSRLAEGHLGSRRDVLLLPLLHDTPGEIAQEGGLVRDWRRGEVAAVPGKTMPRLLRVERDYTRLFAMMTSLGPRLDAGFAVKGIPVPGEDVVRELAAELGTRSVPGEPTPRPALEGPAAVAEAILALSGATNGRQAAAEWEGLARATGLPLDELGQEGLGTRHTWRDLASGPRAVVPTPVWSGLEGPRRRYAPFTLNVERLVPWRTLTGRPHVYLDHELLREAGEALPVYRPPLPIPAGDGVVLRYLTPHGKWGIHSTYADTPHMLSLSRGGPTAWLAPDDARRIGVADGEWVELVNRNGAFVARAAVSHRIPAGAVLVHHAQDRVVGVPASPTTGTRAGTHNSLTRILPKPTHMVGGYAQLAYAFNYYGPTGHQRDEAVAVRRLGEVRWLED